MAPAAVESVQLALFLHGLLAHSFTSVVQRWPENPAAQTHLYTFATTLDLVLESKHLAPFWHGLLAQGARSTFGGVVTTAEQAARAEEDARLRELYPLPEDEEEYGEQSDEAMADADVYEESAESETAESETADSETADSEPSDAATEQEEGETEEVVSDSNEEGTR